MKQPRLGNPDRLGGMRRTTISILDLPIAIDAPIAVADELVRELATRTSLSANASGDASLTYELRVGDAGHDVVRLEGDLCELVDTAASLGDAASLIADNVHPWVADQHPDLLLVHAGVVARNGMGIVVPGRSFSGKSSLVAALLRAGATYLSDEFAPLDLAGNVHPFPRHLSIRDEAGDVSLVAPGEFTPSVASEGVPVGVIVQTKYVPGASFEPERLQGAAALLSVVDNTLVARSRPAHTMRFIAGLAPAVDVLRSDRGDADETAAIILAKTDVIAEQRKRKSGSQP